VKFTELGGRLRCTDRLVGKSIWITHDKSEHLVLFYRHSRKSRSNIVLTRFGPRSTSFVGAYEIDTQIGVLNLQPFISLAKIWSESYARRVKNFSVLHVKRFFRRNAPGYIDVLNSFFSLLEAYVRVQLTTQALLLRDRILERTFNYGKSLKNKIALKNRARLQSLMGFTERESVRLTSPGD
jgi:hypothetical protein